MNFPFLGLSVFIHLCIIFIYRLFWFIPFSKKQNNNPQKKHHIASSLIMLFVFSVVLFNAASFLFMSITNEHATHKVLADILERTTTRSEANSDDYTSSTLVHNKPDGVIRVESCLIEVERLATSYQNSLIRYLRSRNADDSFEARRILAAYFGIKDYKGKDLQNKYLLKSFLLGEMIASPLNESCKEYTYVVNSPNQNEG